ncbi:MAG TPA: isoprenylcysteine carboxylmethyltransferase family protein [Patescibacteria group bacterium]|nr:isoprenylcysteine carboxylmethyltransferase family protein [Patescibacteria group bacterium]
MDNEKIIQTESPGRLKRILAVRFGLAGPVLAALFFLPAGTLDYWQAWTYMAILLLPMFLVVAYFLKKDPELLERRMRMKEKEPAQKIIIKLSYFIFLAAFLLPGFDRRFGWSSVPVWLVLIADIVVLAAYGRFVRVMSENRFLSRVVEVEQQQKVIDTGPYAQVRHPMYAAIIPLYLFSPLALGSFWAMIPAAFIPLVLIARIFNEEKVLSRELAGYRKYARRVKFRLIPGVW